MNEQYSSSKFSVLSEIIMSRRTIRDFEDKDVPRDVIVKILDVARWSPSGSNLQDWRFVIIRDKKLIKALKMFSPGWIGRGSPTVIVICSDRKWAYEKGGILGGDTMYLIHAGIVLQSIALLAYSLGLGTNPILSFSKDAIKELLKLPEDWEPIILLLIGYPRSIPEPTPRLPLDKLTLWMGG
ncbi:nitroreductase family protein [Vulcanisaeta souniana]|uniref:Nitroreductase n=2 Tax=Vulcanisaeta souniana JCM 11219 TaxID=1293586 RepID=A0ABN6SM27_9CREN|nr:nitroreductase family protein [Vulcanisaeta souniana]BDR91020.1 nitroreductase [Vulcanisaeta souniana JCM 11219]